MNAGGSSLLLLDACCVLNLFATDRMGEILRATPHLCAIAQKVEQEALFVLRGGQGPDASDRIAVDLQPLYAAGLLTILSPTATELADYVNFAAELDDGEAMTCAVAVHRGTAVASDDRKARRVLGRVAPQLQLLGTLDLVRAWATGGPIGADALRAVLTNVRDRASYQPGRAHPLRSWWDASL